MRLIPVKSRGVRAVGYEEGRSILYIKYDGGKIYEYLGVPPDDVIALLGASSIGRFVNKRIKPYYEYREYRQLKKASKHDFHDC